MFAAIFSVLMVMGLVFCINIYLTTKSVAFIIAAVVIGVILLFYWLFKLGVGAGFMDILADIFDAFN